MNTRGLPVADRLRLRSRTTTSGCVEWTGARSEFGYGRITLAGRPPRSAITHRVAWELERGPIPEGLCVLHRCDNPSCINVAHLFIGTVAENNADRSRKGRTNRIHDWPHAKGEASVRAKLTDVARECLRAVDALALFPRVRLARWFHVSPQLVSLVCGARR